MELSKGEDLSALECGKGVADVQVRVYLRQSQSRNGHVGRLACSRKQNILS
jgi:hypothetical protein